MSKRGVYSEALRKSLLNSMSPSYPQNENNSHLPHKAEYVCTSTLKTGKCQMKRDDDSVCFCFFFKENACYSECFFKMQIPDGVSECEAEISVRKAQEFELLTSSSGVKSLKERYIQTHISLCVFMCTYVCLCIYI